MTFARTSLATLLAAAVAAGCATPKPKPAATAAPAPPPRAEPAPAPAPPPAEEPLTLAVEPEKVLAPVNRAVLGGFDFGNWMLVVDFQKDLGAVRPGELRFPGGESGDRNDLTEFALDVFKANLNLLGNPKAVIQTRVGPSGNQSGEKAHNQPEDAAAAVRWAKARGIEVSYWEIGNEPDLFPQKQSLIDFTPEKYCEVFRAQAAAIKAVDPSARVAGPAVSGAKGRRDEFLRRFVKACGDVVDVLTWHIYPTEGTLTDEWAMDRVDEIPVTVDVFRKLWANPGENPRGWQRKIDLAVTEYGLSSMSTRMRHLTDMPAAMFAMEAAFRLDALGAASAHYFALQGTLGHGLLDQNGGRRPTWYAYALLAKLSGNLVPARTGDGDVWAHAARDGGRMDVVLTNRATAVKELPVAVPGWKLTAGDYFDEAITKEENDPAPLSVGPSVKLPARSIVHLVYVKE